MNLSAIELKSCDENKLTDLARLVAKFLKPGDVLFLQGDLGAGKTTFVRMLLSFLGYKGRVKSPTFSIVEEYELAEINIAHFDLYRLESTADVDNIGITDYLNEKTALLIEWPENGSSVLPNASIKMNIEICSPTTRNIVIEHYLSEFNKLACEKLC